MRDLQYLSLIGATCMLLVAYALGNFIVSHTQGAGFDDEPMPAIVHTRKAPEIIISSPTQASTTLGTVESASTSVVSEETSEPVHATTLPGDVDAGDGLTTSEEYALLQLHNQVRAKVGVGPLRWSETLAQSAAKWATTLQDRDCVIDHSGGQYGENIYYSREYGAGQTPRTAKEVIDAFIEEADAFNYDSNTCAKGDVCGHYTQIVWANTAEVGCAKRLCLGDDRKEVWVCHYDPPGNVVGQRPY